MRKTKELWMLAATLVCGENYVNGSIKNLKLGNCAHNNSTYEYSRRV